MNVDVNNLTDFAVDESTTVEIVEWLVDREDQPAKAISVAFVDDERMREMNETYYNEEGTTDVLTFDYEDGTIEITLNPHQHRRQASEVGNTLNEETIENFIHGFLHTCGYNHLEDNGEHLRRQRGLMDELFESDIGAALISAPEDVAS